MYFKFNDSAGAKAFVKNFKNNKFNISPTTTNLDFNCDCKRVVDYKIIEEL